jgi:hypothetical protein
VKISLRARKCALVLACTLFSIPASLAVPSAHAEELDTADACVGFHNDYGDKVIIVHASNGCERRLACRLDYTVRCEDNAGKVTSRAARQTSFALASKGDANLSLSATDCKQGWAIDDIAWNCR